MIYADKCRLIDAERKYNPQGGSLFACIVTQGSLLSSATLGYRKYNRVAVVFHPLPAHRNEWNGLLDGFPAHLIGENVCTRRLSIYSIGWNGRMRRLSIYPNGWNIWKEGLLAHSIGWNGWARRLPNGFILKNNLELPSPAITTTRYREKYPRSR